MGAESGKGSDRPEPRILAAWREWLGALAVDAEAVAAASHVYEELTPEARDALLDALDEDGPKLNVPRMAIYAPLLAVEQEPARSERIRVAMGVDPEAPALPHDRVLRGTARDGACIAALISPIYLRFVRVLWCRYLSDAGFVWTRLDPIVAEVDAPRSGVVVDEVVLEATPLTPVVEELAHAILAQGRRGLALPASLQLFAHLFNAKIEEDERAL